MFVGRLDTMVVTPSVLRTMFEKFGNIVEDPLILSHARCGFVQFERPECVAKAVAEMNGKSVGTQSIVCEAAKAKRENNDDRNDPHNCGILCNGGCAEFES